MAAGHSMGGHSLVQAALAHGARFARLVLVDPVMLAPETYADAGVNVGAESVEDHPVSRRRNQWRDWQQMYERFADRDPVSLWQPAVLQDYCRWGVVPDPDQAEGFVLACPPAVEAGIYLGSASVSLTEHLADVTMPVTVIRGRQNAGARLAMDFSASPTWSELAHQFPRGVDVSRPDLTHFIPMQEPQLVADYLMGRR